MNYYPFHIGDYLAHAAHLDPIEDCAYRRLLDQYYLNEGPLTADLPKLTRQIRMKAHADDVQAVLEEFFELGEEGWRHSRCDEEITKFQAKQAAAQENGKRGGRPKKETGNKPAVLAGGESENPAPTNAKGDANPEGADAGKSGNPDLPDWFEGKNPEVIAGFPNQNPDLTQRKANQEPRTNNQNQNSPQPPHEGDSQKAQPSGDFAAAEIQTREVTQAGAVCLAMKSVGIADVNPSHSKLHALLTGGVSLEAFVGTARDCVANGKPSFRYVLTVVENLEKEARDLATTLQKAKVSGSAETAYQRSMRERMQKAAPSIARKAPSADESSSHAGFFDVQARIVEEQKLIEGSAQ